MKRDHVQYIRSIPQPWRAIYTTFWLDCEVNNGGFHQFFWNSDGGLNNETLEDLQLISAMPFIFLFQEALDIYSTYDYARDKASSENTWEAFTDAYREERMSLLDTAYYKVKKGIPAYLADYIRSHRASYQ